MCIGNSPLVFVSATNASIGGPTSTTDSVVDIDYYGRRIVMPSFVTNACLAGHDSDGHDKAIRQERKKTQEEIDFDEAMKELEEYLAEGRMI